MTNQYTRRLLLRKTRVDQKKFLPKFYAVFCATQKKANAKACSETVNRQTSERNGKMNFSVSERALPESFAYPERGGVSLRGLSQADEPRVSAGLASPDSDPEEVRLTKRRVFRTYYGIFAVCAVFLFVQPFAYADHAVNINIADKATLMTLTGIGDVKAQAIIDYRTEHGPFATIENIKNITSN